MSRMAMPIVSTRINYRPPESTVGEEIQRATDNFLRLSMQRKEQERAEEEWQLRRLGLTAELRERGIIPGEAPEEVREKVPGALPSSGPRLALPSPKIGGEGEIPTGEGVVGDDGREKLASRLAMGPQASAARVDARGAEATARRLLASATQGAAPGVAPVQAASAAAMQGEGASIADRLAAPKVETGAPQGEGKNLDRLAIGAANLTAPDRYEQLAPGWYLDKEATPQARAAQARERTAEILRRNGIPEDQIPLYLAEGVGAELANRALRGIEGQEEEEEQRETWAGLRERWPDLVPDFTPGTDYGKLAGELQRAEAMYQQLRTQGYDERDARTLAFFNHNPRAERRADESLALSKQREARMSERGEGGDGFTPTQRRRAQREEIEAELFATLARGRAVTHEQLQDLARRFPGVMSPREMEAYALRVRPEARRVRGASGGEGDPLAKLSRSDRETLRDVLRNGETEEEVRDRLHSRGYGEDVIEAGAQEWRRSRTAPPASPASTSTSTSTSTTAPTSQAPALGPLRRAVDGLRRAGDGRLPAPPAQGEPAAGLKSTPPAQGVAPDSVAAELIRLSGGDREMMERYIEHRIPAAQRKAVRDAVDQQMRGSR